MIELIETGFASLNFFGLTLDCTISHVELTNLEGSISMPWTISSTLGVVVMIVLAAISTSPTSVFGALFVFHLFLLQDVDNENGTPHCHGK